MQGKQVGDYQIIEELAEGGMGMVYRGESIHDGTPVAIKTMRKEFLNQREEVGRFIREAGIYQRLIHPNLMRFYTFGFDGDLGFYLVTELFIGRDLEYALAECDGPLPPSKALDIALQVCAGLAFAHQEGIIHRDLKPGNVFLSRQGEEEIAKVFDFGIAKMLGAKQNHKLTMIGTALGTPLYMAPEQIRTGDTNVGPAADIYALGIMIFQMLAGEPPFTGNNPMEILTAHLRTPPPLLRKYLKKFSGTQIEQLLKDMMAKEPDERPRSLEQIKELLWQARQDLNRENNQNTQFELPNFDELQRYMQSLSPKEPDKEEKPTAVLHLKQYDEEIEVGWLLPGDTLIIGSEEGVDIRIQQQSVYPQHAKLFCSSEGWITIRQLGQAVIRINGAATRSNVLQHKDWITIGEAELQLHCF